MSISSLETENIGCRCIKSPDLIRISAGLLTSMEYLRISLALAFSLAPKYSKNTLLLITYGIVIFSILVQGLTTAILL